MSILRKIAPGIQQTKRTIERERRSTRVPGRLWSSGLYQPLNHVLSSEGKRIRAELVEFSFQSAGGKGDAALELIEFVELLHAGSLVIDDIQDGSVLRRGKPTLHSVEGTPLAINTGNWMYFSALEKLHDLPLPKDQLLDVMMEATATIRHAHEGQALDLAAKVVQMERHSVYPTVRAISRLKTGGVTALAAKLGAALAGANRDQQNSLHSFGMQLGIALQMQNDLVELQSGTRFGGRSDDLRNARVTWPWAWVSRLRSEKEFAELQCLLLESTEENRHLVASRMLGSINSVCQKSIRRKLNGAIGCLANVPTADSSKIHRLIERIEAYHA